MIVQAVVMLLVAMHAPTPGAALPALYRVVHGWPQLPPGDNLGQASGVGVDSQGNVLVFHRVRQAWSGPAPTTPDRKSTR